MKHRIVILSYHKLSTFIQNSGICLEKDADFRIYNATFEDTVREAKELEREGQADAFISSGSNASMLKKLKLDVPVVEIKVSGFDLIEALKKASALSQSATLVTFSNHFPELEGFQSLLKNNFYQQIFEGEEDALEAMESWKREGNTVVIGASLACELAERVGLPHILIYSYRSLEEAVETAIQLAEIRVRVMTRTKQLQAILDSAYSGILACDNKGLVTLFNPRAEKILNISSEQVLGQSIDDLFPEAAIREVEREGAMERIVALNGVRVVTTSMPIIVQNVFHGIVTTFHALSSIQKTEERIRKKIYQKGLVARWSFADIVGKSSILQDSIHLAQKYAREEHTILLKGDTGTGKELFAQGIHTYSKRKDKPFVAINCAALPEYLLESELFGYEGGAFTGARKEGKLGLFELAHQGSIFLDEISEISMKIQARLLRVVQEKEVMRIGGDSLIPVNCRIIAATNRDLWQLVEEGSFREDLYYRINILQITLSSLQERREDIPYLVDYYLQILDPHSLSSLREHREILVERLQKYSWPGNVRQLKNILTRLTVMLKGEGPIKREEFLPFIDAHLPFLREKTAEPKRQSKEIVREDLLLLLERTGGNKSEAAKLLGISRMTLYRKLKDFGIS